MNNLCLICSAQIMADLLFMPTTWEDYLKLKIAIATKICGYCPEIKTILITSESILDRIQILLSLIADRDNIAVLIPRLQGLPDHKIRPFLQEYLGEHSEIITRTRAWVAAIPRYVEEVEAIAPFRHRKPSEIREENRLKWERKYQPKDDTLFRIAGLEPDLISSQPEYIRYPNAYTPHYGPRYQAPIPSPMVLVGLFILYPKFELGLPAKPHFHGN